MRGGESEGASAATWHDLSDDRVGEKEALTGVSADTLERPKFPLGSSKMTED